MKRETKINILLLVLVILLFLFVLEVSLRIFSYPNYGFQKGLFQKDEVVGYKLSPDYSGLQSIYKKNININTNSKGLRDFREYDYQKNNKTRILILGDSTSFGNGVELEDSYPELLRQNFNEEVEIINLGVPGYGINNEYLYYMNEGIKYNPDIVLLQFTLNDWGTHQISEDNGFETIDKKHSFSVNNDGALILSEEENIFRSTHLFLLMRLRSYSLIYSRLRAVCSSLIYRLKKLKGNEIHLFFKSKDSLEYKEAYNGYSYILEKLKTGTNAKIIIFMGPHKLYLANPQEIKEKYNVDYEIEPEQTKQSIKEIAENLEIDVIEITSNDPDIFLKVDGHWTSRGNEMIANELYVKLKKRV